MSAPHNSIIRTNFVYNNISINHTVHDLVGNGVGDINYNFLSRADEIRGANSLSGDPGLIDENATINTTFTAGRTTQQKLAPIRSQVRDNFKPDETSPLIDAGSIIPGYHCATAGNHPDQNCRQWFGSAPDIGPFETN